MDWDVSETTTPGLKYYFPLNDGPSAPYVQSVTNDWAAVNSNSSGWKWWSGTYCNVII